MDDNWHADLHEKESQICRLGAEGELIGQRRQTIPVASCLPRASILLEVSTESEWVAP